MRCLSQCLVGNVIGGEAKAVHLDEDVVYRKIHWFGGANNDRFLRVLARGMARKTQCYIFIVGRHHSESVLR